MGTVTAYETAAGKRYRVRYRTPDQRQTDKRGFRTKREAEEYLVGVEVSKLRGEWVDPRLSRVTVAEWGQSWFEAQVHLKPSTLSGYRSSWERYVAPRWGRTRLADVKHEDVQAWITKLSTSLAPGTVRQVHHVLVGLMKYAVRADRIARNPCDGVRLPRRTKSRRGYLTHEQVAALAAEVGPHGDVVLFLAYTGLRWGEMAGLKVGRLDMLRRRLEVIEAVAIVRGRIEWGTPKSHERRSVPFPALLIEPLARRCEGKHPDDLVFVGEHGGVMRGQSFRRSSFDAAIRALRARDLTFPMVSLHDLRHTAASLAVSAGANVKAVQRMLGHSSAAMTLDVYTDLFDDDLDAVAVALDNQARAAGVGKPWAEAAVTVLPTGTNVGETGP